MALAIHQFVICSAGSKGCLGQFRQIQLQKDLFLMHACLSLDKGGEHSLIIWRLDYVAGVGIVMG